jgi:hypothetical protein
MPKKERTLARAGGWRVLACARGSPDAQVVAELSRPTDALEDITVPG